MKASSPLPHTEPRPVLLWGLALLPVLAAYANVVGVGFMWDDHVLIEQNTDLHTLQSPWAYVSRSFWQHPFLHGQGQPFYRPLVVFSLALDWTAGGGGPLAFHLTNLALHLATCTLVFVFAHRRSQSAVTAAVVTALFGVMPRLTESVTWIVGRTDVIATLLVLLALWSSEARRVPLRAMSGLLLFFALLAKEVALVGAAVVIVEAGVRLLRGPGSRRVELPTLLGALTGVLAWAVLRSGTQTSAPLRLHDAATFLAGVGNYALMILTPWHPLAQNGSVTDVEDWAVALGLASLVAVAVLALRWSKTTATWRATWLLAAAGAVLMVSLVQLAVFTIACDRFLYLPLAFVAVIATQRRWSKVAIAVGVTATLALAVVTSRRNELWGDPLRFWMEVRDTASPKNPGAFAGLADVLFERSRFEDARNLYLQAEAARLPRRDFSSRLSLAVVESRLGNDAQALSLLGAILEESPQWRRAAYDLVLFRARALDFRGARAALSATRARFGDDEVLRDFEAVLGEQEPRLLSEDRLVRARALHALGATRKAEAIYESLLGDARTRAEAARWLVVNGAKPSARAGLDLLPDDAAAHALIHERFPPSP